MDGYAMRKNLYHVLNSICIGKKYESSKGVHRQQEKESMKEERELGV